ncbi:MAG: thioredoxin family protein [Leeuwenhoekiella sp.]
MKSLLLFTLLLFFGNYSAEAQKKEEINWLNWNQLENALEETPKPVFLFFEADWCVYCKKIEREVFTKASVITTLNKQYYALKMDAESTENIAFDGVIFTNEQARTQRNGIHELPLLLASREGVPFSLPATVILDKQFSVQQRVFEYYTSAQLLAMLD